MRFHKIPYSDGINEYTISPFSGSLLKSHILSKVINNNSISSKIELINNPYDLEWTYKKTNPFISLSDKRDLKKFSELIFKTTALNFFCSIVYSRFQHYIFETSRDAFSYLCQNFPEYSYGQENCLQRCLLVAKSSKSFKKNGAIFVGAELTTCNMHAWIIENRSQPDPEDRVWINYKPLLAITF